MTVQTEILRDVAIGMIDKCNQIETLLMRQHLPAWESLAEIRAWRSTLRGYLVSLKDVDRIDDVSLDRVRPGPKGPHGEIGRP